MNPGFQTKGFKVYTTDGHNFVLLKDVLYLTKTGTLYVLPGGATSDGASTPPELWLTIPPFGSYWQAAYLHDCAYRDTLMIQKGDDRQFASLTEQQSNDLLNEAMIIAGTHELTRIEIYKGVCLGGKSSFTSDRAQGRNTFMMDTSNLA